MDIAEITPDRSVLGSELLLSSANLRVPDELGVAQDVVARGVPIDAVRLRLADDTLVATIPVPSAVPELPPSVGIARRALHDVLYDAAVAAGATVHHGSTVERARGRPRRRGRDAHRRRHPAIRPGGRC